MSRASVWGRSALVLALLALPAPALGQSERLQEADRLLQDGRFMEARSSLERWMDAESGSAGRIERQHGLWLRALLTIDPGMAETDFRRLVIEYPGGPYSDHALLRLAHGAEARGDLAAAQEHLDVLLRDYPGSALRVEARTLRARFADLPPTAASSAGTDDPEPAAPEDLEVGRFTVQVGAFSTEERALPVVTRAREAGLDVRLVQVPGSLLVRIRTGAFESEEEAQARVRELREQGFEAVLSSDRESEVPFR